MVNKIKITGWNSFNGDRLGAEGNHKLNNDKKTLFPVFWQFCDAWF